MKNGWLENKNIVVIGGTSGIGLSAARAFIAQSAKVVVLSFDQDSCESAKKILGENAVIIYGDARTAGVAQEAIQTCSNKFGSFDGLYHVAGGSGRKWGDGPLHELSLDGWNATMELNLTSLMLSNQAAVKWFLEKKKAGSILNIASVLAYAPSPKYFATHAYAASKSAAIGFTKSIASYYAKDNIRINVLAPALVETPMSQRAATDATIRSFIKTKQPLDGGRIGMPDDLDGLAIYFMSDYSKFTTGQIIAVDGGWSLSEGQTN
ncbi:MAG: short-chain dehydrogenase [Bacteroidetes bacterium]|nr:MAG: short-chain dehydrogenase [Bacteroidota bacterium]